MSAAHVEEDYAIGACPAIYQRLIRKSYELRVTIIGESIFTARVDSQRDGEVVDWRYEFPMGQEPLLAAVLPEEVSARCLKLCHELSLKFAAIDLIVDECGDHVFLEVNCAGQFLFVENRVPELQLLDYFSRFLANAGMVVEDGAQSASLLADYFISESYLALVA